MPYTLVFPDRKNLPIKIKVRVNMSKNRRKKRREEREREREGEGGVVWEADRCFLVLLWMCRHVACDGDDTCDLGVDCRSSQIIGWQQFTDLVDWARKDEIRLRGHADWRRISQFCLPPSSRPSAADTSGRKHGYWLVACYLTFRRQSAVGH